MRRSWRTGPRFSPSLSSFRREAASPRRNSPRYCSTSRQTSRAMPTDREHSCHSPDVTGISSGRVAQRCSKFKFRKQSQETFNQRNRNDTTNFPVDRAFPLCVVSKTGAHGDLPTLQRVFLLRRPSLAVHHHHLHRPPPQQVTHVPMCFKH